MIWWIEKHQNTFYHVKSMVHLLYLCGNQTIITFSKDQHKPVALEVNRKAVKSGLQGRVILLKLRSKN